MARTRRRIRCRWATVDKLENGERRVEVMSEMFRRTITGEHCVGCGKGDSLWEGEADSYGRSRVRLCTACGTLTQFPGEAQQPQPAADFWLVILRQIQKAAAA